MPAPTAAQARKVAARVNRLVREADRNETAAVRALLADLEGVQDQLRTLVASRWGEPYASLATEVDTIMERARPIMAARLVASLAAARAGGSALIDGVADVLDVPVPVGEAIDDETLDRARATGLVRGILDLVDESVTFHLLAGVGKEAGLRAVLAAIGAKLVGSAVMGRAAERLAGAVRTEVGAAYGAASASRSERLERSGLVMRKRWLAYHRSGNRGGHLAVESRYAPGGSPGPIPFSDDFRVGTSRTPYPRGPGLPASEKRHCRCRSVPVAVEVPKRLAI